MERASTTLRRGASELAFVGLGVNVSLTARPSRNERKRKAEFFAGERGFGLEMEWQENEEADSAFRREPWPQLTFGFPLAF